MHSEKDKIERYVKKYLSIASIISGALAMIVGIEAYLTHSIEGFAVCVQLLIGFAYIYLGKELRKFKNPKSNIEVLLMVSGMSVLISWATHGYPAPLAVIMLALLIVGFFKIKKYTLLEKAV